MSDLFNSGPSLHLLPAEKAEIKFSTNFLSQGESEKLFNELRQQTDWKAQEIVVWGKSRMQPRLIAWHGDRAYSYSSRRLSPEPWTPLLREIQRRVEAVTLAKFNSVLLNLYRDGNDSMGAHSDDERELGPRPTIASVSLGQTRTIRFIPKSRDCAGKPFKLALTSGSLLLMSGDTQANWKHEISKEPAVTRPRINLTFRYVYD